MRTTLQAVLSKKYILAEHQLTLHILCSNFFFKEIIKSQRRFFEYIDLSVWSRDWGSQCEIHPKSMAKQFDSGRVIDGRV